MMQNNPFLAFGSFDASRFDLTKAFTNLNVPGLDVQAFLEAQRKNIEALAEANRLAVEGMQAIARRESEILAQAMTEAQKAVASVSTSGDPRAAAAAQVDIAKQAFERAIANMRELADLVTKSNTDACDVVNKRVSMSLDEIKAHALVGK